MNIMVLKLYIFSYIGILMISYMYRGVGGRIGEWRSNREVESGLGWMVNVGFMVVWWVTDMEVGDVGYGWWLELWWWSLWC